MADETPETSEKKVAGAGMRNAPQRPAGEGASPRAGTSANEGMSASAAETKASPDLQGGVVSMDKPAATQANPSKPAATDETNAAMSLDAVRNIPVTLTVVLGSVSMPVSELMNLQRGKTIALDKKVGDPVDVLANGKLIARGEIVVLEEDEPVFAISLTELVGAGGAKAQ